MRSVAGRKYVAKYGKVVHLATGEGWNSVLRKPGGGTPTRKPGRYIKTACGKELRGAEEAEGRLCFQCDLVHSKQERERLAKAASVR